MNEFERIGLMAELAKQSAELYYDFDNEIKFLTVAPMRGEPAVLVRGICKMGKLLGVKPTVEYYTSDDDACMLVILHEGVKFHEHFNNSEELPKDV